MIKIGLVTVLFNSDDVLEGFFKSLSAQTFKGYYLYIVDNTPNEKTDALIQQLIIRYPISGFEHISNPANYGVAKGNNQGIEKSVNTGYTYTLLLNNDIEFEQDFLLQEMYDYAVSHREHMIIPKIYFHDTRKIWLAGGNFRNSKGIVNHIGIGEDDGPLFNTPAHFDYAPTCFMLIDNVVFKSIGLMDEKYFVYYDDTDFVFRAIQAGYKIFYMPSLNVLHKVSSSTGGEESLFSIYYSTRNRVYFLRKNFNMWSRIPPMAYTLVTRMIRYFMFNKAQRKKMVEAITDGFKM